MTQNQPSPNQPSQGSNPATLSPKLVKEITEKVYALLIKDLKITQERGRGLQNPFGYKGKKK